MLFLRSSAGTDRSNALWMLDTRTGETRCVAEPGRLQSDETVPAAEQARRERLRERATGITGYATDRTVTRVAFSLSGRLFAADLSTGDVRELPVQQPVDDPRPDPAGSHIAYVSEGELRLIGFDGTGDRALVTPDDDAVRWGVAEFIAAEEMGRNRGYWWSPEGTELLVARVDDSEVRHWYLGDPAEPAQPPTTMRYPAAGTPNAEVGLFLVGADHPPVELSWDRETFPYVVTAHWSEHGPPLVAVQTRDQRCQLVLEVDPTTGGTREIARETDPHWVEIKAGWPAWTPDGHLVRISARDGAYRLLVGERERTGPHVQVRAVLHIGTEDVLVSASEQDPAEIHVYRVGPDGTERVSSGSGVHAATRGGSTVVLSSSGLETPSTTVSVVDGTRTLAEIDSYAEAPELRARVELLRSGERSLRSALLLPRGHEPGQGSLPVLLDPYGGPQAQRVLARQAGYLSSQWFADQGFAVVVTDGRGTGGRGPEWDRAIAGDLAGPPLDDQIDALHALAAERDELDPTRVAIRGWSFGGYLAALAVLRRPDVFHAAIAGAPVTDWRLYDTHYTERYLGDPNQVPATYGANSLLDEASRLQRPLMLIHGTVDDNVVPAHSLRLSEALTASCRPHSLLPLPGVSHMPTAETTTENLLLMQLDFLRTALGGDGSA